jgi:hypothetical protein
MTVTSRNMAEDLNNAYILQVLCLRLPCFILPRFAAQPQHKEEWKAWERKEHISHKPDFYLQFNDYFSVTETI